MLCVYCYFVFLFINYVSCSLWPKGVVHYMINTKDYDVHSQDVIMSTLNQLQKEICVKFFFTPTNYTATEASKLLYINNPDKRKNCPPEQYNFNGTVVDMVIGYKCLNPEDITRITVEMLRASVIRKPATVNSYDLLRKFQEQDKLTQTQFLISANDRNFINAHYHNECGALLKPLAVNVLRSDGAIVLNEENEMYYKNKLWPLGVVLYAVEDSLRNTAHHVKLMYAMTTIEMASCVVFQELSPDDVLVPKSLLWFGTTGEDSPALGFVEANQSVSLSAMIEGSPGHTAHTLFLLLRALGIPMASNRYDRNNYITIHWSRVIKGKEHFLEKSPREAWVHDARVPYDFDSATHAPANFMCAHCSLGETTVEPAQDHLWQKTLLMGHRTDLSEGDKELLNILYSKPCRERVTSNGQEKREK